MECRNYEYFHDWNRPQQSIRRYQGQIFFHQKNAVSAMGRLKEDKDILGCIILSTCNRMEIWASVQEDWEGSLLSFYVQGEGSFGGGLPGVFHHKGGEGRGGASVLPDQRPEIPDPGGGSDHYPGKGRTDAFQGRLLYGRRAGGAFSDGGDGSEKSENRSGVFMANTSVIHQAIDRLENQGFSIQGKTCMVIGNGEMGKVTALALKEAGADVTVTVRQYRSGMVTIPQGCERINYGDRMELLPQCDLVVSATASPNCTITKELFENAEVPHHVILIDLAVPRDIDPEVGELQNVTLYDIDSFKIDAASPRLQASMEKAGAILKEQMSEFYDWFSGWMYFRGSRISRLRQWRI